MWRNYSALTPYSKAPQLNSRLSEYHLDFPPGIVSALGNEYFK